MALGLKERIKREKLAKEQKRAERMGVKNNATGQDIVKKLSTGRQISSGDLDRISMAVSVFRNGGEELERVLDNLRRHQAVLYKMVEEEFKGDWISNFEKLISSIPSENRFRPFAITWPQWLEFGMAVGMNEEDVVGALKILMIFRDR